MESTLYYLSTCSTCTRIIKELQPHKQFKLQDIKTEKITEEQLQEMRALSGSYEALFSKKARKYQTLGLNQKKLSEPEMKSLILEEYTFLKRPVIVHKNQIFIGNSKETVSKAKAHMKS